MPLVMPVHPHNCEVGSPSTVCTDLLKSIVTSKRLLQKKAEQLSSTRGMVLLERIHTFVALNWDRLMQDFSLLSKIMEKAYYQNLQQLMEDNVPTARTSVHPGVPIGFSLWGVDVGKHHSSWQALVTSDSSNILTYSPPSVPLSNRIKFWRNIANVGALTEIRNLLIEGACDDLNIQRPDGQAAFVHKTNQGLVLRTGYVFESRPHLAEPEKFNPDNSSNKTYEAILRLRHILPHGLTNRGMMLVRITNIENFAPSEVHSTLITPAHKDDERYGSDIFSLSLWASSSLVFARTRDLACPPVCVWPDEVGTLSHFSNELRTEYYHYVPNNHSPRVSVTWRPFTQADLAPRDDPLCKLCKMCYPNNTEPHQPCSFHSSQNGQLI